MDSLEIFAWVIFLAGKGRKNSQLHVTHHDRGLRVAWGGRERGAQEAGRVQRQGDGWAGGSTHTLTQAGVGV